MAGPVPTVGHRRQAFTRCSPSASGMRGGAPARTEGGAVVPFNEGEVRVSRATLAIVILAVLGFALVALDFLVTRDDVGYLSVPVFCSAALVRVRYFFCQLNRQWQAAFDMGVTVGREQERESHASGLRSLH